MAAWRRLSSPRGRASQNVTTFLTFLRHFLSCGTLFILLTRFISRRPQSRGIEAHLGPECHAKCPQNVYGDPISAHLHRRPGYNATVKDTRRQTYLTSIAYIYLTASLFPAFVTIPVDLQPNQNLSDREGTFVRITCFNSSYPAVIYIPGTTTYTNTHLHDSECLIHSWIPHLLQRTLPMDSNFVSQRTECLEVPGVKQFGQILVLSQRNVNLVLLVGPGIPENIRREALRLLDLSCLAACHDPLAGPPVRAGAAPDAQTCEPPNQRASQNQGTKRTHTWRSQHWPRHHRPRHRTGCRGTHHPNGGRTCWRSPRPSHKRRCSSSSTSRRRCCCSKRSCRHSRGWSRRRC